MSRSKPLKRALRAQEIAARPPVTPLPSWIPPVGRFPDLHQESRLRGLIGPLPPRKRDAQGKSKAIRRARHAAAIAAYLAERAAWEAEQATRPEPLTVVRITPRPWAPLLPQR